MSFSTSWNMAISLIEGRIFDFRSMWRSYQTDEKIKMPDLQHRLLKAVENRENAAVISVLKSLTFESMKLEELSERDVQRISEEVLLEAGQDQTALLKSKLRQALQVAYLMGVCDVEELIQRKKEELAVQAKPEGEPDV